MERFKVKPEVYFNTGALEYLTTVDKERALVITDPFMLEVGFSDQLLAILKNSVPDCNLFSNIKPDPSIDVVADGVKQMLKVKPDILIALGGGSTIDAAKSILWFYEKILRLNGESEYERPLFVAIPTTSGTGSEVTTFAVITLGDKKIPLVDDQLLPDVAIIDPMFVKTVPPQITADTAIDALTHAIEAYVSTEASDYSDALSEKAVKIIFDYLLAAYKNGNDLYAREKLHNASCIAGMAFTNAYLGLNHSLAHALGGSFHIPHGRANAIILPHVIRYNANLESGQETLAARRYAELSRIVGLPATSVSEGVHNLIAAIKVLLTETNTPTSLRELNVDKGQFDEKLDYMSETALNDRCTATNPRSTTKKEISALYIDIYGEIVKEEKKALALSI
ncbi:1-propanol dehydrogenase PduQ [Neobacillus niacini]|uniref:1-propanol dehydrogenase PduQ n=1 Tax=Neobacillus niacini TaxID=86668 RepID=UPI00203A40EB|nr:1-propanol dehydrogenase PduQ [Neobacillus niacini]MCM3691886.1 iron-containing alcohol dehydrogenase [Neobacillus niacini]